MRVNNAVGKHERKSVGVAFTDQVGIAVREPVEVSVFVPFSHPDEVDKPVNKRVPEGTTIT